MPVAASGDAEIYWEEHGEGEPLLLVMGTGYALEMWHRVLDAFAARYRTLVFDNRGAGRSSVPPPPYTIPDMAADAAAVLDAAGVERAHVVAAWLGGAIAEELAIRHPERVRSLVLVSTCAFPHAEDPGDDVYAVLAERAAMPRDKGARATVPFMYAPQTPAELIEEDLRLHLAHYPSTDGYLGQRQATNGYANRDSLAALDLPVLVLHGAVDRLVPPGNGEDLAELIPGARYVEVADASHNVFTDQPEEVVRVVTGFLDER